MYPINSIAVIAPVIFIVLMVAFPLIGLLGGWKRALYWGGGNFVFYIMGMIVWRLAAYPLAGVIAPMVANLLKSWGITGDLTRATASFLAPIFFIVWFAFHELVLLINYYAWFKRVVGLKKEKNDSGRRIKVRVNTANGKKVKAINMVGGFLGMGALMIPSTIGFTNCLFYLTTSKATRLSNKLSNNLYNSLNGLNSSMWWFSYYSITDTAIDYDGLYAGLSWMSKTITHKDPITGEEEELTIADAIQDTFVNGLGEIFAETQKDGPVDFGGMVDDVNKTAESWNNIVDNYSEYIKPVFESNNVAELVTDLLESMFGQPQAVSNIDVETYFGNEDCLFDQIAGVYNAGEYEGEPVVQFHPIPVDQKIYDGIEEAIINTYNFAEDITPENKETFESKIKQIIPLIFQPPKQE